MKKLFYICVAVATIFTMSLTSAKAQDYKNAIGLGLDFGDGTTLVGPSFKHFFKPNFAGQFEVVFGNHTTAINALFQYHGDIDGASGLRYFLGGGPSLHFFSFGGFSNTTFALKPQAGLEYKLDGVPLAASFDWRPSLFIGSNDSDFAAGRFGLGFRYTF